MRPTPDVRTPTRDEPAPRPPGGRFRPLPLAWAGAGVLLLAVAASLLVGAGPTTGDAVLYSRLPRAVLAVMIGAALAVAGAIMQLLTRNPLASPQTLGVNACAALAMVITTVSGPLPGLGGPVPAFLGAALGGLLALSIGARGFGRSARGPLPLALAGMTIHLLCTALVEAVTVLNDAAVDVVFWLNGALSGAQWADVRTAGAGIVMGLVLAWGGSRSFQVAALGREGATALGRNHSAIVVVGGLTVVLLAGSAVAVAGPIGFVGLVVPHLVKLLVGHRPHGSLPLCAIGGAVLLVLADTAARLLRFPAETPVGVLTALLGAPLFLVLARRALRRTS